MPNSSVSESEGHYPGNINNDEEGDAKLAQKRSSRSPSSFRVEQPHSEHGKTRHVAGSEDESAEEDELLERPLSPSSSKTHEKGARRIKSLKRKSLKVDTQSSKRSRSLNESISESRQTGSPSSRVSQQPLHPVDDGLNQRGSARTSSPGRSSRSSSASRRGSLSSVSANNSISGNLGIVLTSEEVDEFLNLIYKHHPDSMTAENMKKSVEALHYDWQTYCSSRDVPVMAKKPLMDEYGKIYGGVYGSRFQKRAKAIAQELSQRSLSSSIIEEQQQEARGSQGVASDSASDLDNSDLSEDETETADRSSKKEAVVEDPHSKANASTSTSASGKVKASSIARVGRNGLAVLPPGLFDILRTHLRDDILSGIMPTVRNDISEQTRELFLQNQDLFNRIRDMEEQIRNQDLWIRHLLARDTAEWPSSHEHAGSSAPNLGPKVLSRSFGAASKDSSRISRYGPPSESEYLPPQTGQSGGDGVSPRQQRFERRPSHQPLVAGPAAWDPRTIGGPTSERWDGISHVVSDRRASYAVDLSHRKNSWTEDVVARGIRSRGDHPDFIEPQIDTLQYRRVSRPAPTGMIGATGMGGPAGVQPPIPGHLQQPPQQLRPVSPHDEYRRHPQSLPSTVLREDGSPPESGSMYDVRRPYQSFTSRQPESHFSVGLDPASAALVSGQFVRSPLPPRSGVVSSDVTVGKNKRGRPTNAENLLRTDV